MDNIEMIGKVKLDLQYYQGKDVYTDGDDEDLLLEIVMQHEEKEFNSIIAGKKNWTLMYHFSHLRENIIKNVGLKKEDCVLEIGSGCGAVTGAIAGRSKQVTCVDLSKKRSLINAYRHQNCDNINILVGNFQTVEEHLGSFDVITLIGVFEYAGLYINAEHSPEEFLRIIRKHLNPGGRIVMAIENKFGMKYWAGCTEDHFGTYFEGIEGYTNTEGIKTFSKKELEHLFKNQNLKYDFYYPYPDYKFAMQIFSDDYLPQPGELSDCVLNFDRERMWLFDEQKVFTGIINEGLFPEFSNSYLVVLQGE